MTSGSEPAGPVANLTAWLRRMLALPNESPEKTLFVAVALCLVCSIAVSGAAVLLKPIQIENKALDRKRNILEVAGLLEPGADVDALFERIETRMVDLETGELAEGIDPATYDMREAARDPTRSELVSPPSDIASIGRRPRYAPVYFVRQGDELRQVILPVHGYGLWSTLYGFLALEGDLRTIAGLKFYEHAETPGLGGEVDNPAWRAKWEGKLAFGDEGDVRIEVAKGPVDPSHPQAEYRVDGLSGATLTSRGITNMLHYWLGEEGFGPFLARLRSGRIG